MVRSPGGAGAAGGAAGQGKHKVASAPSTASVVRSGPSAAQWLGIRRRRLAAAATGRTADRDQRLSRQPRRSGSAGVASRRNSRPFDEVSVPLRQDGLPARPACAGVAMGRSGGTRPSTFTSRATLSSTKGASVRPTRLRIPLPANVWDCAHDVRLRQPRSGERRADDGLERQRLGSDQADLGNRAGHAQWRHLLQHLRIEPQAQDNGAVMRLLPGQPQPQIYLTEPARRDGGGPVQVVPLGLCQRQEHGRCAPRVRRSRYWHLLRELFVQRHGQPQSRAAHHGDARCGGLCRDLPGWIAFSDERGPGNDHDHAICSRSDRATWERWRGRGNRGCSPSTASRSSRTAGPSSTRRCPVLAGREKGRFQPSRRGAGPFALDDGLRRGDQHVLEPGGALQARHAVAGLAVLHARQQGSDLRGGHRPRLRRLGPAAGLRRLRTSDLYYVDIASKRAVLHGPRRKLAPPTRGATSTATSFPP